MGEDPVREGPLKTILAVDDDSVALGAVRQILQKQGYDVATADNGESALEWIATHDPPDLILLDVTMPGLSGFETCRRIRAVERTAETPVVFLTARSQLKDMSQASESGSDLYLVKPVLGAKLLSFVGMFLGDTAVARRKPPHGA